MADYPLNRDADAPGGGLAGDPTGSAGASTAASDGGGKAGGPKETIVVKVALVGDSGVGKTSLMVRYVERRFDADYVETLGVNFMERTTQLAHSEVTMSIWDLGGDRAYASMLPMVTVDAVAVLFMFDLTQRSSLTSVREWYRQVRGLNKTALPFLVGTKYDVYYGLDRSEQEAVADQARKFARAMRAPLIFCSASHGVNVLKLFRLIFEKVFSIDPDVDKITTVPEPLLEY